MMGGGAKCILCSMTALVTPTAVLQVKFQKYCAGCQN